MPDAPGTEPRPAELAASAACRALLVAYADRIDAGTASRVVELFTEDAVFAAGPRVLSGRAQLEAAFAARQADAARNTRHLVLNASCVEAGEGTMEVRSTLLLFVLDAVAGNTQPPPVRALVACADRMLRGADSRWRIASRRMQLVAGAQ